MDKNVSNTVPNNWCCEKPQFFYSSLHLVPKTVISPSFLPFLLNSPCVSPLIRRSSREIERPRFLRPWRAVRADSHANEAFG